MPLAPEISAKDTKARIDAGEKIYLVDVREPSEHATARIEGAELIPMKSVPQHLDRLDQLAEEATLVVFCHHGMRSLNTVNWLRGQGVEACQSMAGGIEAWSNLVDPSVPRY